MIQPSVLWIEARTIRSQDVSKKNHYFKLGVSRNASPTQIKSAYLTQVKLKHPDRNPNKTQAHRQFTELQEAYSVLSDVSKRKAYDEHLQGGRSEDFNQSYQQQQQQQQRQQWQHQSNQDFDKFWEELQREIERAQREQQRQEKEFYEELRKRRGRIVIRRISFFELLFISWLITSFISSLLRMLFGHRRRDDE